MTADEFRELAFPDSEPESGTLWLNAQQQERAAMILRHAYPGLRVRYWRLGQRSAWILEEVGKDQPITMGIVVEKDHIADFAVLAFRESRGGEIRYPFFTDQFRGLTLSDRGDPPALSGSVNGITGATLSVRAASKVAKLALFFHRQVMAGGTSGAD
ncbi:FMN-binding protein [Proteobacteria bacterium 005FR1]|nr:FMN-binding protein [Proteobacteria bacterium 005FR1]